MPLALKPPLPAPSWPNLAVLLLMAAACWPIWAWSLARMQDGSDDPYGLAALLALLLGLTWRGRQWGAPPRAWPALAAAICLLAATVPAGLPMLLRAVLAVAALGWALAAMARQGQPLLPFWGLGLLALPLLSSLQFYAGYPLRLITAECSLWLLRALGLSAERSGVALTVADRLILVDAPCSGVHMAWTAYFTAFVAALIMNLPDRVLLRRLPLVGLAVLAGNVWRNTVLVSQEALGWPWPAWAHEAVGLLAMLLVGAAVLALMGRAAPPSPPAIATAPSGAYWQRRHGLLLGLSLVCGLLPWLPAAAPAAQTVSTADWPTRWDGRAISPLPLSPVEQRFAQRFPGSIGRFHDGQRLLVLRQVTAATRMLHPATDCYRGLGYTVREEHLERDPYERLQRCFMARRGGQNLRVCERISDAGGQGFTDTSSWYWAAALGRSSGPWLAVTTAEPL